MKKKFYEFKESNSPFCRDYKLEYIQREAKKNFESLDKWLYLGADELDANFAKIGITMGNLTSRSYCSSRPSYYLFCAFKFIYNISKQDVKRIEDDVLSKIDILYRNPDDSSKRMIHYESRKVSECFYPVNFFDFYKDVHLIIYNDHRNSFEICGYENEDGEDDGEFVDCIYNSRQEKDHNKFRKMILQY